MAQALISLTGSHGYEATTIEAICGLAEVSRSEFLRRFADKEECYLDAYDEVAAEFGERVLGAYGAHIAWHDKVWGAGWEAMSFLQEDPVRARFFAVEVNCAGDRALVRRDRVMQIFADLIDAGRAELEDPEALTTASAEIVTGAIYYTIQNKILEGCIDRGEDFLVDLVYIAVLPYLGPGAAEADLRVQPLR
jgi:AcrR family transcriptional regulator